MSQIRAQNPRALNLRIHYSLCFCRLEMYNDDSAICVFASTCVTADLCC